MRAVTGTVTSSKAISLSKASSILSRFATANIGARRDVTAYMRRAANAFEDLVQFNRELRRKKREIEHEDEVHRKKRKEEEKENGSLRVGESVDFTGNVKKNKNSADHGSLQIEKDGDLGVNVEEKKKKKDKKLGHLGRNNEEMNAMQVKVEEVDAGEERRKKKEMKRKHLSVEGERGEAQHVSENREKKKRKIKLRFRCGTCHAIERREEALKIQVRGMLRFKERASHSE